MFQDHPDLTLEAKQSPFQPGIFKILLLAGVYLLAGSFIGGLLAALINILFGLTGPIAFSISLSLTFGLVAGLVFRHVVKVEKRSLASMGFVKKRIFSLYFIGFILGLAFFSLVVLILIVLGEITLTHVAGLSSLTGVLLVLPAWIIQGGTEEVITRGWIQPLVSAKYSRVLGVGISSTYFAALHLLNPHISLIALVNILLVGILLSLYVLKTNELWGVCGFHSAWNWAQGNIYGFSVSGTAPEGGSILTYEPIVNSSINGGSFGPEAGLVSTAVLCLGILLITFWFKLKRDVNNPQA